MEEYIKARELKGMLLEEDRGKFGVIAFVDKHTWWHIHDDEEVPSDREIAFRGRETGLIFSLEE